MELFLMYVVDTGIDYISTGPELTLSDSRSAKYPLMILGYTVSSNLSHVITDRRSNYNRFRSHIRYYRPYMDIFKYIDNNKDLPLTVEIKSLGRYENMSELNDNLSLKLISYRFYYGDACLISNELLKNVGDINRYLRSETMLSETLIPETKVEEEVVKELSSIEKRRQSKKRYEDKIRDSLREKSKLYYAANKELLRQKRLAKKNGIVNSENNP